MTGRNLSQGLLGCHNPEDGGNTGLRNVGILPQHHTASQSWRPWNIAVKESKLTCS